MSRSTAPRAQLSVELVPFIAIAFAFLLVFVVVIAGRLSSVREQGAREGLEGVVAILHDEIRIASAVSEGYRRNFTLPARVGSKNYSIGIVQGDTIVALASPYEASTRTFNVTGQPVKGTNLITKNNGLIRIN